MNQEAHIKASIVIPTFSNPSVLRDNISKYENLVRSEHFEVIIVDDHQEIPFKIDHTSPLKLIRNLKNRGVSYSRNVGMNLAIHNIVLFIDDDIEVEEDVIKEAVRRFSDSDSMAFSCMHSDFFSLNNFPTRYKSKYMKLTLMKVNEPFGFIYGSLCGLKKKSQHKWNESMSYGEDTFLATKLLNDGLLIDFYKDLDFKHHKSYSLSSLLKNDFLIPYFFAKSYVLKKKKEIHFSHTNPNQLMAIATIPLTLISPIIILIWLYLNRDMYRDFHDENKVKLTLFTFLDQTIMGIGIFFGLIAATCNLSGNDKHQDLAD